MQKLLWILIFLFATSADSFGATPLIMLREKFQSPSGTYAEFYRVEKLRSGVAGTFRVETNQITLSRQSAQSLQHFLAAQRYPDRQTNLTSGAYAIVHEMLHAAREPIAKMPRKFMPIWSLMLEEVIIDAISVDIADDFFGQTQVKIQSDKYAYPEAHEVFLIFTRKCGLSNDEARESLEKIYTSGERGTRALAFIYLEARKYGVSAEQFRRLQWDLETVLERLYDQGQAPAKAYKPLTLGSYEQTLQ